MPLRRLGFLAMLAGLAVAVVSSYYWDRAKKAGNRSASQQALIPTVLGLVVFLLGIVLLMIEATQYYRSQQ